MVNDMFKSTQILNDSLFKIKKLNGYECYKKSNDRYYHCFVNQNESLNNDVKWNRISKSEYDAAENRFAYLQIN